jgi:outer membrane protein OmpA-like peptidoglycan-associated protein
MKIKIYSILNCLTIFLLLTIFIFITISGNTQTVKRNRPVWWVGESVAGNFNFYTGTTQVLNESVTVPTAFHNGNGLRLYFSFLAEYRKNKVWGGMFNLAFNNRSSSFDGVLTPTNSNAYLYTVLRYVNIEPSLRVAPFSSAFYLFAGPTLSINSTKEFFYEQVGQHETRGNWSKLRKYVIGGQAGIGTDIPISKKQSANQLTISPFVSYQTNLFDGPRKGESWSIYSFRTGLALKFGTKKVSTMTKTMDMPEIQAFNKVDTVRILVKEIHFSIDQPKVKLNSPAFAEIFPLINSVFFNYGSTAIPDRYIQLNQSEAIDFKETQLQKNRPVNWYNNRSERQLLVYYNILNLIGDRLRNNPSSTIGLVSGPANNQTNDGKALKESIKHYLVSVFGINETRIKTDLSSESFIESVQQMGDKKDKALRMEEDRRVDIISTSPEILAALGHINGTMVREDITQSQVSSDMFNNINFNVDGASELLSKWSLILKDNQGISKQFGPFTNDNETISKNTILGNSNEGNYAVSMIGETKNGQTVKRESTLELNKNELILTPRMRYSVLFKFDRFKSITANENFLTEVIAPLVTDSSTIIIQGHTDILGSDKYNQNLSVNRVRDVKQIIERSISSSGKKGIKYEYYGFGMDMIMAPFQNTLPEARFYNRTVIIDIIQGK